MYQPPVIVPSQSAHFAELYTMELVHAIVECLVLQLLLGSSVCTYTTIYVNNSSPDVVNDTSCWSDPPCFTLALGLRGVHSFIESTPVTLIIAEGHYDLSESLYTTFENVSGISIIGSPSNNPPTTVVSCTGNVGFEFVYSSDIVIHGIEFSNCNQPRNSTSYGKGYVFEVFYVSFYLLYCTDMSLQNISITNNNGTGLVVYNPAGSIVIEGSRFYHNQQQQWPEFTAGGGGVYIEFSYCVPYNEAGLDCLKDGISNVDTQFTSDTNISIRNCIFYRNKANASSYLNNTFILPSGQHHYAFGRGGGLSLFFKGSAKSNNVVVDGCSFIQNSALWGGGIFAEFQDNSTNNSIRVYASLLHDNDAFFIGADNVGTGGGASRVGYIFFDENSVHGNSLVFQNCSIINNRAVNGGGISFYSARHSYDSGAYPNSLSLVDCVFRCNSGRLGTALSLSPWYPSIVGRPPTVAITNCNFTENYPIASSLSGILGLGAVYVDALPVVFCGSAVFTYNKGSALVITSSHAVVGKDAVILFVGNRGRNGGAIELLSASFIVSVDGSRLVFIANSADYNGGAIYHYSAGENNMIGSQNCFLRFQNASTPPQEWTSTFYFEGNLADGKDNAVYTPTLLPCLWGGRYNSSEDISVAMNDAFCWNENWIYMMHIDNDTKRDRDCSTYIATAPSRYTFPKSRYSTFPGEVLHLNISVYDNLNHSISEQTAFLARILSNTSSFGGFNYRYVSHGYLDITGVNSTLQVQFETIDPVVIQEQITVTLNECPPGFLLDQKCYCLGQFHGYIHCDNTSFTSSIDRGVWLGPVEVNGQTEMLAGLSPYVYRSQ